MGQIELTETIVLAELHWYDATGIGGREFKINQTVSMRIDAMARTKELVICVKNEGYAVSLERRKLYVALPDAQAAKHGHLRVIE